MFAGDLEIKAAEQRVEERRKAAEGDPDNEQLALQLEEADRSLQELEGSPPTPGSNHLRCSGRRGSGHCDRRRSISRLLERPTKPR